ncbi:LysR family transcriptional regulator, partial [Vibrio rotiferianus]
MNLTQVEAFCTIAEYGSVSEAARQLDCNRTKLSMAIKALEKDLDVELFNRTGNQLNLSEAGKAIYKDCESLLVTAQRIKKTCAQVSDGFNAEVWVARDDSLPDDLW